MKGTQIEGIQGYFFKSICTKHLTLGTPFQNKASAGKADLGIDVQ